MAIFTGHCVRYVIKAAPPPSRRHGRETRVLVFSLVAERAIVGVGSAALAFMNVLCRDVSAP
jgi:hypothetical protein